MELALFPLNTVLFPEGVLPLRIFETRYLDMISACLRNDSGFGVCLIREGSEVGGDASVHSVGTLARIVDWNQRADGLLGISILGEQKMRVLTSWQQADKLMLGEVALLPVEAKVALPEEFRSMSEMLQRVLSQLGAPYNTQPADFDCATWVGSRLTELLPLESDIKQRLLELDDPLSRLFWLRDAMTNMDFA